MDACSDSWTKKIVLIFASQTGKSELLLNVIGYFIDYDGSNMLLIQPTVEMAEAFSKDRIASMLSDTPSLAAKVADPRSRASGNTISRKEFPGGSLTLVGANAPSPLASRFIRVVLADEVDRFPISAGSEGDPLKLAEVRQTTFYNALTLETSTPTVSGESRIQTEYEDSTQEEWCVPCPSCGCYQSYEWPRLIFPEDAESGKRKAESAGMDSGGGASGQSPAKHSEARASQETIAQRVRDLGGSASGQSPAKHSEQRGLSPSPLTLPLQGGGSQTSPTAGCFAQCRRSVREARRFWLLRL
jgi:phage terminase large subunit GpA-like protein